MNIAIVDNDRPLLRSLEILLGSKGHHVTVFDQSVQAIEFLRKQPIDILIVDYVMPELTGTELLETIKQNWPRECKIIMLSGHIDQIDRDKLADLGVTGFLAKPFDLEKLCNLISQRIEST